MVSVWARASSRQHAIRGRRFDFADKITSQTIHTEECPTGLINVVRL